MTYEFNALRNPITDGDKVKIKDKVYKITSNSHGWCALDDNSRVLPAISEIDSQSVLCAILNSIDARRYLK